MLFGLFGCVSLPGSRPQIGKSWVQPGLAPCRENVGRLCLKITLKEFWGLESNLCEEDSKVNEMIETK